MPPSSFGDDPILISAASDDDIARWRRDTPGFHIGEIDGRRAKTEAAFFDEAAHAFSFPDHFGGNWDAFYDVMLDLDWLDADGYVIYVDHADDFMADEDRERIEIMVATLTELAEEWAGGGGSDEPRRLVFRTVLRTDADSLDDLRERIGPHDIGDLAI